MSREVTSPRPRPILPTFPVPVFGESVVGYFRRLTELCGFPTLAVTSSRLRVPLLAPTDPRWETRDLWGRLCWLTGQDRSAFAPMRWQISRGEHGRYNRIYILLEKLRLNAGLADPRGLRFCPACLREDGVFRTAWSITYLTACVKHRTALIDCCPECGVSFRSRQLRRIAPWTCTCGADLRKLPTSESLSGALRLAKAVECALPAQARAASPDPPDLPAKFAKMALSDLLLLVHTLGFAGCTPSEADLPCRIGRPIFPHSPIPASADINDVQLRINSALSIMDDWPSRFYLLLEEIGSRNISGAESRKDKKHLSTKVGKLLLYPPCGMDGAPIGPIVEEVDRFFTQGLSFRIRKRRIFSIHPAAVRTRLHVNLSTLARELSVPPNQKLLNRAYRRVLDQASADEQARPPKEMAKLVRERTLRLYAKSRTAKTRAGTRLALEGSSRTFQSIEAWDIRCFCARTLILWKFVKDGRGLLFIVKKIFRRYLIVCTI